MVVCNTALYNSFGSSKVIVIANRLSNRFLRYKTVLNIMLVFNTVFGCTLRIVIYIWIRTYLMLCACTITRKKGRLQGASVAQWL